MLVWHGCACFLLLTVRGAFRYRTTARIWDQQTREIIKVLDMGPQAKVKYIDCSQAQATVGTCIIVIVCECCSIRTAYIQLDCSTTRHAPFALTAALLRYVITSAATYIQLYVSEGIRTCLPTAKCFHYFRK